MAKPGTTTLRKIDRDDWRKFKIKCAENDISMNDRILELIKIDIKERPETRGKRSE